LGTFTLICSLLAPICARPGENLPHFARSYRPSVALQHARSEAVRTMVSLAINGRKFAIDVEPDMPLLWALRDELGMVGTKFGCGAGLCGACTVLIDGEATRSCITPVSVAAGRTILTIEGLGEKELHAVQKAWIEADAPQCGYCQSGQIMAAVALISHNPHPSDADIDDGMTNICRCGTYPRIRAAVHRAAELIKI
jgi:isoquinoline 1-oxidoreductase alpha subunit